MNIYPEIKKIASNNDVIMRLSSALEDKIDCEGMDWSRAHFISGVKEKDGHIFKDGKRLDNGGLVDNDYYCHQKVGYDEDDYYGTLYFKTNVPGQFVAIPFAC